MGSCVSVDKNPDSDINKLRFSASSKANNLLIPSPNKPKSINGEYPVNEFGFKSRDFGSKEAAFFDTQPWLDSDCEDDFLSVNGEFTPSCGTTPVHQSSFNGTPQLNKSLFMNREPDSKPEPSPTDKKKKLAELFRESFENDQVTDKQTITSNHDIASEKPEPKSTNLVFPPKSANGTPYIPGANSNACSNEKNPSRDPKPEKENLGKSTHCCLPHLSMSRSFNERKKRLSADDNGGG